jgi:pyruvate/2-oxoacid:ferredoxin oxidoreductase alpha subunit/ferredoxin
VQIDELFVSVAGTYAEYIVSRSRPGSVPTNVFGRTVDVMTDGSLATVLGLAATGIRTAAHLTDLQTRDSMGTIAALVRQNIPSSILISGNPLPLLPELSASGAIIFLIHDAQALADRLLMAPVIAEKSMRPVVILVDTSDYSGEFTIPGPKTLIKFFGDPDGFMDPQDDVQRIVFGNKRKRTPTWIHQDLPVSLNVDKDRKMKAFESAARQLYFTNHIGKVINETEDAFDVCSGRRCSAFNLVGSYKPSHTVFTTSGFPDDQSLIKKLEKQNIRVVILNQLAPLPDSLINTKGQKSVSVIESAVESTKQGWLVRELVFHIAINQTTTFNGWYSHPLQRDSWERVMANATAGKSAKKEFWVDVPFHIEGSRFPKHEIFMQELTKVAHFLSDNTLFENPEKDEKHPRAGSASRLDFYKDKGPAYSRISRFYNDTACFYDDIKGELIADPFKAMPLVPPATAHFIEHDLAREQVPVFHAQASDRIDDLVTACPNGAMPSALVTIKSLLDQSIKLANKRGAKIGQLVPLLNTLTNKAGEVVLSSDKSINSLMDFLPDALLKTFEEHQVSEDKRVILEGEFKEVMSQLAEIPIVITEEQYLDREKREAGSGEVFTLAVDPSACNGCGICAVATADGAISMEPVSRKTESELIKGFLDFENLPDTNNDTITRLIDDETFDSFADLLLSRHLYSAFTAGGKSDEYASERTIVRMFCAFLERILQPRQIDLNKKLNTNLKKLNDNVKKILSDAIPITHLDALMSALSTSSAERISFDRIVKEWGQNDAFQQLDKRMLERKLSLIEGLQEWQWGLKEGMSGTGKSRYSVVVDDSLSWITSYPWNNFTVPVIKAQPQKTSATALGVFRGQMRHSIDQIRLLRRAELEATNSYDSIVHDRQIAGLDWSQLSAEEKDLIPPVVVMADQSFITSEDYKTLSEVLESGFPIKFLLLDGAAPRVKDASAELTSTSNAWLPLIVNSGTYIGRVSLSNTKDLFNAFHRGMKRRSGAVFSVLCPQVFNHEIDPKQWKVLNALAVNTRAFIPLQFNPTDEISSYNMNIDTSAIPDCDSVWQSVELKGKDGEEESILEYRPTWADWAFTLVEWKSEFTQIETNSNQLAIQDYLALNKSEREGQVPVITRVAANDSFQRYAVSDTVIEATSAAQRNFAFLMELAGLTTEYPEKLEKQVTETLRVQYENEKSEFIAGLEKEKRNWEEEHLDEIKKQIKSRLMQLAGRSE